MRYLEKINFRFFSYKNEFTHTAAAVKEVEISGLLNLVHELTLNIIEVSESERKKPEREIKPVATEEKTNLILNLTQEKKPSSTFNLPVPPQLTIISKVTANSAILAEKDVTNIIDATIYLLNGSEAKSDYVDSFTLVSKVSRIVKMDFDKIRKFFTNQNYIYQLAEALKEKFSDKITIHKDEESYRLTNLRYNSWSDIIIFEESIALTI